MTDADLLATPVGWAQWNQLPRASAIYAIIHLPTGLCYIGSAVNLYHRARQHRYYLQNGKHHSSSPETIEKMRRAAQARSASAEYRAKLSKALTGKTISEATRMAIRWSVMGFRHTPEARAKISAASTGRRATPEARAKMSAAQKGRYVSPETCARISAAKKGIKPVLTEEAKRLRSERMKAAWVIRRARAG